MTRFTRILMLTALMPIAFTACSRRIYTPPSHIAEMQTPKSLAEGESRLAFAGGLEGAFSHNGVAHGSGWMRRGFGSGLEGTLGINAIIVDKHGTDAGFSPLIMTGHGAAKYNPPGWENYLGLLADIGAGTSAGGQFISGEAGFVLGVDQWIWSPYLGAKMMANQPFNTRSLNLGKEYEDGELPDGKIDEPVFDKAEFTHGFKYFAGLKVPLGSYRKRHLVPRLIFETNVARLEEGGRGAEYFGALAGLELPIRFKGL